MRRHEGVDIITKQDDALLARISAGDRDAMDALYERHCSSLVAYLRLFTSDQSHIEELVQDTMVAAWKGADRFAGRSSVRSWLFAIARRRAIDTLRRRDWRTVGDEVLASLPDPSPGPEVWALAQASQAQLIATIERLSPIHREILVLIFVSQLSYSEVAKILDIPLGTVKSRLNNARKALRAHLRTETS